MAIAEKNINRQFIDDVDALREFIGDKSVESIKSVTDDPRLDVGVSAIISAYKDTGVLKENDEDRMKDRILKMMKNPNAEEDFKNLCNTNETLIGFIGYAVENFDDAVDEWYNPHDYDRDPEDWDYGYNAEDSFGEITILNRKVNLGALFRAMVEHSPNSHPTHDGMVDAAYTAYMNEWMQ